MEGRRQQQRGQREDEEDQRSLQVQEGHEGEDQDWRQRGHDQLRHVLAEERVELFDAVDQGKDGIAGTALVEVTGAELQHVVVQQAADARFHAGRGGVGDLVAAELQQGADDDETGDQRQHADERLERFAREGAGHGLPGQGQAQHRDGHRRQADECREGNPPADAARHAEQTPVEIQSRRTPVREYSGCWLWRRQVLGG